MHSKCNICFWRKIKCAIKYSKVFPRAMLNLFLKGTDVILRRPKGVGEIHYREWVTILKVSRGGGLLFSFLPYNAKQIAKKFEKFRENLQNFDVFHFFDICKDVAKNAFFYPIYEHLYKITHICRKSKQCSFFLLILCPNMGHWRLGEKKQHYFS